MKYKFKKVENGIEELNYPLGVVEFSDCSRISYKFSGKKSEFHPKNEVKLNVEDWWFCSESLAELIEFLQTVKKELDGE